MYTSFLCVWPKYWVVGVAKEESNFYAIVVFIKGSYKVTIMNVIKIKIKVTSTEPRAI